MRATASPFDVAWALARHGRAARPEIEAYQARLLKRLVAHAYAQVPYYRRRFEQHGVTPADIRGLGDLARIPLSSKDDLRAAEPDTLLARTADPARLIATCTSGSSGHPFTIRQTWLEQRLLHPFRLRALRDLGVRPGDCIASIGLHRTEDPRNNKLIGRILHTTGLLRRARLPVSAPPAELAARLARLRPDVLSGYPGAITRLAGHLRDTGDTRIRPRLVLTGAEVLTPTMRDLISGAFGAPVRDTYGSQEFNLLAWECASTGAMHVCDDGLVLEVLVDGRPARPGEMGEVVGTNLHAYAMPFIRYRLGDLVVRDGATCACGRPYSTIREVRGRMIDYLLLPDGRAIHPSLIRDLATRGLPIRQFELIQGRRDHVVLRVVLPPDCPVERVPPVEPSIRELLGPEVEFRIEVVPDIDPDVSGKFRPSRSLVHSEYVET